MGTRRHKKKITNLPNEESLKVMDHVRAVHANRVH
jgi:hypothetical protein